jgi:hypothetical protein
MTNLIFASTLQLRESESKPESLEKPNKDLLCLDKSAPEFNSKELQGMTFNFMFANCLGTAAHFLTTKKETALIYSIRAVT